MFTTSILRQPHNCTTGIWTPMRSKQTIEPEINWEQFPWKYPKSPRIYLPKPKNSGFQWKKASLVIHSPWQRASDCLIWRNLSHKNKNMMAGHFSHLLLPALFHLCLQKWGNFSGYMPYSLAALDETSSLDSHNGTKNVLKVHFNSHTPMISKYIFGIVCHQKKRKLETFFV